MPIFDYTCTQCANKFEAINPRSKKSTTCPICNGRSVRSGVYAIAGYTMAGDNSASTRPKQAGSFKKRVK